MYLFFDTETTGLPRNWKAPITDLDNWPRMVQLAWLLYDNEGALVNKDAYIIRPDGFTIPEESSRIHGITTQRAMEEGEELGSVLEAFNRQVSQAECLVAHNMSFDEKIAGAEFLRNGMANPIPGKDSICTMSTTTDYCQLEGPYGYKWPKLTELHHKLFGEGFEEAHDAGIDISATARCFWELRARGVL